MRAVFGVAPVSFALGGATCGLDWNPGINDTWRMQGARHTYTTVEELLSSERPAEPVYCIHPGHCVANAKSFVEGFPGRVLYAVKANDHPDVVSLIHEGGVRHFDCASLPEIETVRAATDDATCYFMTPVRLRGAARAAQEKWGVRHFLVDHPSGVELLAREVDMKSTVVFARMAVSHASAMIDLSTRFGAPPDDIPAIVHQAALKNEHYKGMGSTEISVRRFACWTSAAGFRGLTRGSTYLR